MVFLTQHLRLLARNVEAVESGQRALAIGQNLEDLSITVLASQYLGQTYFGLADYAKAIQFSRAALTRLATTGPDERFGQLILPGVFARTMLARSWAQRGQFHEARALYAEAIRLSEATEQPVSLMHASFLLGECLIEQGLLEEAAGTLDRSLSLSRAWHVPYWEPLILAALGYLRALEGRVPIGVVMLEESVQRAKAMNLVGDHFMGASYLAAAYMLAGRIPEAVALTARTLELSREHSQRGNEAHVLRLAGEVACRSEPVDVGAAERSYRQASELATELGMRPLVAHCQVGQGTLYRRTARRAQALQCLTTATAMYREMNMTYWLGKAEAEMRELGDRPA